MDILQFRFVFPGALFFLALFVLFVFGAPGPLDAVLNSHSNVADWVAVIMALLVGTPTIGYLANTLCQLYDYVAKGRPPNWTRTYKEVRKWLLEGSEAEGWPPDHLRRRPRWARLLRGNTWERAQDEVCVALLMFCQRNEYLMEHLRRRWSGYHIGRSTLTLLVVAPFFFLILLRWLHVWDKLCWWPGWGLSALIMIVLVGLPLWLYGKWQEREAEWLEDLWYRANRNPKFNELPLTDFYAKWLTFPRE